MDFSRHKARAGIINRIHAFLDRRRLGELLLIKGYINAQDLRFALAEQRKTGQQIGEIFVNNNIVNRRQLSFALARQSALRLLAAGFFLFFACIGGGRDSRAGESANIVKTAAISQEFGRISGYSALFGTDEKRSGNLGAFTKWMGMFNRHESQMRAGGSRKILQDWRNDLAPLKNLPVREMAERVNNLMNEKPYIIDSKNWGQSDYWETPVEFMKKGGDCEDFAIAKYMSLLELGIPEERMRIAIVQDTQKNIPHAVLALYADDEVYILDNQIKSLVDGGREGRYRPIFSINRQAWWLHTAPDVTQIASR